jgi:hypothetical protein
MGGLAPPEAVAAGIPAPPPQRATGGWIDVDHDLLARGQPARGPPPALDSELVVDHAVIAVARAVSIAATRVSRSTAPCSGRATVGRSRHARCLVSRSADRLRIVGGCWHRGYSPPRTCWSSDDHCTDR